MNTRLLHRFSGLHALVSDALFLLLLASLGLLATHVHAQTDGLPDTTTANGVLDFSVGNVQSDSGTIRIEVSNSKSVFAGEGPAVASFILPAQLGTTTVTVNGFPPGEYAIRVMHDVDGDGELKTNMLGMPKEPWGMSNNASGSFGPPKWKDAKFTVPSATESTTQQEILLRK
ncbi:MAG: DUF2141 domain-containing protein [Pseudomonadales bacterium]